METYTEDISAAQIAAKAQIEQEHDDAPLIEISSFEDIHLILGMDQTVEAATCAFDSLLSQLWKVVVDGESLDDLLDDLLANQGFWVSNENRGKILSVLPTLLLNR
jgi:hypothetical protein